MCYLRKMNLNYLHHLINHENIFVSVSDINNKKIIINLLINHYRSKRPKLLVVFD